MAICDQFLNFFFYYEPRFRDYVTFFYCRAIYRIFLLYDVTGSDVRKRTVIRRILRIRERIVDLSWTKSCGRYMVGIVNFNK